MTNEDLLNRANDMLWDNYNDSFTIFKSIAINEKVSKTIRAEACNMQGVIVSAAAPDLGEGDESGLSFYVKAIELDPLCKGALLNIVFSFNVENTNSVGLHENHELFLHSYFKLKEYLVNSLSEKVCSKIDSKYKLFLCKLN